MFTLSGCSIHKVGDFKLLALRAEQDGHLRQRLQHVLKLSKVCAWIDCEGMLLLPVE